MARLDGATWDPAGTTPGGYMDPRLVIFHVTAGEGDAQPHSGLEWHFEVSYSGAIEQGVDTNQQAAANYLANPFAISIETEGFGDGVWTDAQLDSLVLLSEWSMANHPLILRQRCPVWDGSGFGYHVMFGAPGPWTPVAKSCPGPRRIRQFDEVLLPRILTPATPEDDPLSFLNYEEQRRVLSAADTLLLWLDDIKANTDRLPDIDSDADKIVWGTLDPAQGLRAMVAELLGRPVAQVDAAAIAAAIPADLAEQVADELGRRLSAPPAP